MSQSEGGDEAPRLATQAIHAGEALDPTTGAATANLVMSTSFVAEQPFGFSVNAFEGELPYFYSRWGNPTVAALEQKLAALEQAEAGLAFASGMGAIAGLMFTELSAGDHLIISEVCYPGTAELVRETLSRFAVEVSAVDCSDLAAISAARRSNTRLIWVETPANPILRLTDIAAVAQLAKAHDIRLAVDSTFATPVATRPLTLGADYVVHSLTKYIGGHGDALGGMVLGRRVDIERLRAKALVHQGAVLSPFNAWLIGRGAATLPIRMAAHASNAMAVATFLERHRAVARVLYPGLASHPQHALALQQMENTSGMLAFRLHADGSAFAAQFARSLETIHYAVSLGHHRSLLYWIDTDGLLADSYQLDSAAAEAYREIAGDGVFRMSVGLEDPVDLCRDLDRVLSSDGAD